MIDKDPSPEGSSPPPASAPATPTNTAHTVSDNVEAQLQAVAANMASNFEEARQRFLTFRRTDPFPEIDPALLNCADFCDYVAETGMLWPFNADVKDVKIASYDFRLLGRAIYWDENRKRIETTIEQEQTFVLQPNSIAFVTLEPYLQLPDYIALRFNLRIMNVYRGLLLGTGPIIDPGYQGRLSIPLHNLTTNAYTFRGGESLISVEFTKIATHERIKQGKPRIVKNRSRLHIPFPEPRNATPDGTERNVANYLLKADSQRSIQSSLPPTIKHLEESAGRASLEARQIGVIAAIGVILGIGSLFASVLAAWQLTQGAQQDVRDRLKNLEGKQAAQSDSLRLEQNKSQLLELRLDSVRDSLRIIAKRK
jgi:deoxycytidine triphosphate deaminase